MDQSLLENLLALSRLNLDPDVVREVLEHEKWTVKEKHRHEKEMAMLGVVPETGTLRNSNAADRVFNTETSHGQCDDNHIGLIAKAKVSSGALIRAKEIENPENLPLPLLSLPITVSWCGQRMGRWTQAKDIKVAYNLRDDLDKAVEKYGKIKVHKAFELVSAALGNLDTRIVTEQLDAIQSEAQEKLSNSFSSSPLFAEFHKAYPFIESEQFDKVYEHNNREFVKTAVHFLRSTFNRHPPSELSHIQGWDQRYLQHLPNYLKLWQDELRKMETRMRIAQKAWRDSVGLTS